MIFSGSSANLQQGFRVDMNWGGIPAKKVTGEPLVIYCGVIDILQCYKTLKKLEERAQHDFFFSNSCLVKNIKYEFNSIV